MQVIPGGNIVIHLKYNNCRYFKFHATMQSLEESPKDCMKLKEAAIAIFQDHNIIK